MSSRFELIAFDADDTLWHNEIIFQSTHKRFVSLLEKYHEPEWILERLFKTEIQNLKHFGYGIKGFTLSMIETAVELTEGRVSGKEIQDIVEMGRDMLAHPVELLDGVKEVVEEIAGRHPIMLLTKGDLLDQETKLARSGLGDLFSDIEIVSEKNVDTYAAVLERQNVHPEKFLMVGNSIKSDIIPVLEAGGEAVYIPYQTTWAHEQVPDKEVEQHDFTRLESIQDLPPWLWE